MYKIWNVKKPDIDLQKKLSNDLGISPLLSQLLINRGATNPSIAERFLSCNLSDLHNPFLFKGMDKAVVRIKKALEKKEKIVIWGDYDVDGLTAVALLKTVLIELGGHVEHYIPNRIEEGYGLNLQGAQTIVEDNTVLVITVDCGVNSNKEVEFLNNSGIDVIITDHHQPLNKTLPPAFSIINPLQDGCNYPFKYLAGVGIAFKLAQAVTGLDLFQHLDFVVLGTISDIVPMKDENRIFVKHGLNKLTDTKKIGLLKLIEKLGLKGKQITAMHVGFLFGPRLNATGRMGSAENSLKLLMSDSAFDAECLAGQLNDDNRLRQQLEAKTLQEALDKIEKEINFKQHRIIVLFKDDWHPGVTGIVASRIVERFYRPAILLSSKDGDMLKGSGRSIDNFHLFNALASCEDFLDHFGGHSKACGLSIKRKEVGNFIEAINKYAFKTMIPEFLVPSINIDAEIPLSLLNKTLIDQILSLGPFGPENPKPVFVTRAVELKARPEIVGKNTIKMWVTDTDVTFQALGFKMAEAISVNEIAPLINIVYTVAINEWQGTSSIELNLKDIKDYSTSNEDKTNACLSAGIDII